MIHSPAGPPPCPVCQSPCTDPPLYRYSAVEAATHFCPPSRSADRHGRLRACISRLWGGDESVVLRCRECGFGFGHPFVGGDEEFYGILHEQKGYPGWRWDYDVALEHALNGMGGGRVLDIGAGVGKFLAGLGPEWQRFAVEASDSNRSELEQNGVRVFQDLSIAVETEAGTFQAIVLFQVLEHIAEFKDVLEQCRKLLAPNGKLVITVPDGDAMIRQERLVGCPDMPPNHINKFTPDSLTRALREAGFATSMVLPSPTTWGNVVQAMHMRVMADAAHPHSLAAQAYRVSNKRVRVPLLALLGLPALLRLLPHLNEIRLGGAFAIFASPA